MVDMGHALYRKYRTTSLAETAGQEHITKTLQHALHTGAISHAYLFTGPRGVGKTSLARIFAHAVNNLPYSTDSTHLDIIEIDAASNRRIDEIRELRERIHIAPTSAHYKVYIIDEVHMLTKEAFNALLKTLEEPPEHAIFILATTEAHKVPDTIISRTQRFTFRPYDDSVVTARLRYIADKEEITIDDDALRMIAQAGGGSFRDSISLLDQVRHSDQAISTATVQQALGIAPAELLSQTVAALQQTPADILRVISDAKSDGYQSGQIAKQLVGYIRQSIASGVRDSATLIDLMSDLIAIPAAKDIDTALEIALMKHHYRLSPPSPVTADVTTRQSEAPKPAKPSPAKTAAVATADPVISNTVPTNAATKAPIIATDTKPPDDEAWPTILATIKKQYNTLYGVLRMASADWDDNHNLTLGFQFAFHQKRINEPRNKQIIVDIIREVTGRDVAVSCVAKAESAVDKTAVTSDPPPTQDALAAVQSVFGNAEVLPAD